MSTTKFVYVFILGIVLAISGCSLFSTEGSGGSESAGTTATGNAEFDNMLAEVTAKYNALAKEGGAWTISEDDLKEATKAAQKSEFDKAIKLLKEVDEQTTLAKAQFEQGKKAGPHLF